MKYSYFVILFLITCLYSCKKEPGIGGDASITGQVWVKDYNSSFTGLIGEYPGSDEYVYIVFGDHPGYDKRIKTDYNGEFLFEFLYEGDYTIYTYSVDSTLTELDETLPVIKKVSISGRKEKADIGQLIIAK